MLVDKAELLSASLSDAIEFGAFGKPQSGIDFVKTINEVLQESFPDRHLGILTREKYSQMVEMFSDSNTEPAEPDSGPHNHEAGHAPNHAQPHAAPSGADEDRKSRGKKGRSH